MTPTTKSTTSSRLPWRPTAGFFLLAAPAATLAAEEKAEEPKNDEQTKELVGTSTLQPSPETITQGNWKPLAVTAAIYFIISAVMCVLIFKLYTKRRLV
ncbi:MAG: hypothetical protein AAGA58_08980 [Verrucomicrobiota bacterium]